MVGHTQAEEVHHVVFGEVLQLGFSVVTALGRQAEVTIGDAHALRIHVSLVEDGLRA